jgi:hypothetical protein
MPLRQTKRPGGGRARPQLETLEDRWCPSVVLQGHNLLVSGSSGGDQITVRDGGHGNVTASVVDSQGHRTALSANGVGRIVINSSSGSDRIDYALTAPLTTSEQVVVNVGSGRNQIGLDFSRGVSAPSLIVQVHGGRGDNTLWTAFGPVRNTNLVFSSFLGDGFDHGTVALLGDVTGNARVSVGLAGGAGYDGWNVQERGNIGAAAQVSLTAQGGGQSSTVHVDYAGKLDGKLTVVTRGGRSFDWLESTINLIRGSVGSLTARAIGGQGDDVLTLLVHDQGSHMRLLDALEVGGRGTNYGNHTPNVRTVGI